MIVYTNQEKINSVGYGEEAVNKYSEFQTSQFDEKVPNQIEARVQFSEFHDDSGFFQYGQAADTYDAAQIEVS